MINPTDFKKGVEIQDNPETTRADHLGAMETNLLTLYNNLEGWEEFGPDRIPNVHNVQRKLLVYSEIYLHLAELAGECERFALWCDAKKKNEYEKYMIAHENEKGSAKYKEIHANRAGHKYRLNRDHFRGLAGLWRNRMEATREAINILKWIIRDAHEANKGL